MDCLKFEYVSGESLLYLSYFLCFSPEYPLLASVNVKMLGEMDS